MACADSTFTGNIYNIQIPVKVIPDIISHDTDLTYAGRGRRPMGMPVYIQMTGKLYDCADHGRTDEHIACKTRRSEEHTSELQSLMRISYAVFCLKKKNKPLPTHAVVEPSVLRIK